MLFFSIHCNRLGFEMAELRIRSERLPIRCEICHQSDCFDAKANCCSRCKVLIKSMGNNDQTKSSNAFLKIDSLNCRNSYSPRIMILTMLFLQIIFEAAYSIVSLSMLLLIICPSIVFYQYVNRSIARFLILVKIS